MIFRLWKARWNLLRLVVAGFLLWTFAVDGAARTARTALRALPDFDYAAEVRSLRLEGRYGEALMVAQAGLEHASPDVAEELRQEQALTTAERDSLVRRLKDAGMGALSGKGETLEALVGAVAADFFVVGDLRDLVIQGGKQLLDGDSDPVILLLSVVGVVTTIAPEVDWVPSLLKVARRAGTMTEHFAKWVEKAIKGGEAEALSKAFADVKVVAASASPGGAVRLLRHVDDPEDLRALAEFARRRGSAGTAALHIGGDDAAAWLRASRTGTNAADAELALLAASRKGPAGVRFLASPAGRILIRPHPLVGLLKSVYKGNAAALATRWLDRLDPDAWWIVPLLASWTFIEGAWLLRRLGRRPQPARA